MYAIVNRLTLGKPFDAEVLRKMEDFLTRMHRENPDLLDARIIRVLERKGHLTHRVEGKAHVYRARQQPAKSRGRVLGQLIKQVFGGSAASLVLHLVDTGDLTEDDLREVRQQIAARAETGKGVPAKAQRGAKR